MGPLGTWLGTPSRPLGTPSGSLGTPWGSLGTPKRLQGSRFGKPWRSLEIAWGPLGIFGDHLGIFLGSFEDHLGVTFSIFCNSALELKLQLYGPPGGINELILRISPRFFFLDSSPSPSHPTILFGVLRWSHTKKSNPEGNSV